MVEGKDYEVIGNQTAKEEGAYSFSIFGTGKYKGYIFVRWYIVSD